MADDAEFRFRLPDGSPWIPVEGGGLEHPIAVKVRLGAASLRIVGLRIDGDDGAEITSTTLRSIRPGRLGPALHAYLKTELQELDGDVDKLNEVFGDDFTNIDAARLQADPEWWSPAEELFMDLYASERHREELKKWVGYSEEREFRGRTRGASPPTEDDYRGFALVYLEELDRGVRGAKSRTAKRVHMDRGTVYRWIRECESRGLVPKEEKP